VSGPPGSRLFYPTPQHELAAAAVTEFFSAVPVVEAVLQTGSTARGRGVADSCLDFAILLRPEALASDGADLEARWHAVDASAEVFERLRRVGAFSHVDLDLINGAFCPGPHGWTTGPDEFELEIGNVLTYAVALWEGGSYWQELRALWLPYYDEELRARRLAEVVRFCLNNLDHIQPYAPRGLYFQAFRRFYNAFGEFLQALFISRRTYPIAYDKWIREQVEDILGLPELYRQLPALFEIAHFESDEIVGKAERLRSLLMMHVTT
jgi:hypothetical protein